ncbi:unnamed protein product [Anisakis simplex]|uniref:Tensin-4 (inferred by orthology to a human protein) n=1 Tax=Anisakis simplex TaxID=6269 RepID=A0A0M3JSL2_ANISI|nr:unnamed protein product [Anisakis simplex]
MHNEYNSSAVITAGCIDRPTRHSHIVKFFANNQFNSISNTTKSPRAEASSSNRHSTTTDIIASSTSTISKAASATATAPGGALPGLDMQLAYITNRIIATLFPSDGTDAQYRTGLKDATVILRRNHPEHYKIFNVSKKRSDLGRLHPVVELGWPQELSPPLDRLCSICKMFENWLAVSGENVIVVHCKGGYSRAAIVIAAYMHYISICSSEESISDRFAMQRFSERFIGNDGQPSHKRYVNYFASLLSGRIKINPSTIYLHQIRFCNFSPRSILLKIYERMQPVYTTPLTYVLEVGGGRSNFDTADLPIRGDVLVKCFQRTNISERSAFFRCQFNTCTFDLSKRDGTIFVLRFNKDELDGIFNGQSLFLYGFIYRSESLLGDGISVEYAEIHRPANSTDSGIGSDSTNIPKEKGGMPPVPPPKPRLSVEAGTSKRDIETDDISSKRNEQHTSLSRSHSALPSIVRPTPTTRSESPMDGRSTPCIEPDLVAKDRYDPASKCFSYVPAKALNEHFTTPRKPMQWQRVEEPRALDTPPLPSEIAKVPVVSTELVRRPETPKWDDEIDKITNKYASSKKQQDESTTTINGAAGEIIQAKDASLTNGRLLPVKSSSTTSPASNVSNEIFDETQIEEKPMVIEQAKRATKRRKTKYGSYKTLNDDAYNSDMDDLCDPDFYLSYGTSSSTPLQHSSADAKRNAGSNEPCHLQIPFSSAVATSSSKQQPSSKSVELPRKPLKEISPRDRLVIDEAISTPTTTSKPATSLSELNRERDSFRSRNCRSATSAPIFRESRTATNRYSDDRYDSLTDAESADDWLKSQLKKLKTKRDNNPEVLRRKRQEKMLLEELKHASDDRQLARGRDERNYSVEGYGQRTVTASDDALTEYQIEEERLRNTRSPYPEQQHQFRDEQQPFTTRRVMPPKSATDFVRHKPPTPPPRARSRSPPASPYPRRSFARTPTHESPYQQERNNLQRVEDGELINDVEDGGDFSHLKNIVQFHDRNAVPPAPHYQDGVSSFNNNNNNNVISTRSILKRTELNNHQNWSPSLTRRSMQQTPVEEVSLISSTTNRTPTPSFPVRRETPLPYHPLLFNGASEGPIAVSNTLNYRSASPRSLYYAQSRRTSMTSLEAGDIIHHHPVFVKDTSKYWYKPTISREEAINMLRDKPPGTFVVRDSNSFPGAFGLALKVATPPPGIHSGDGTELVRHFLIEPSPKGVKLKGCNNEPIFGTLSALVYQHSITALALPTKLLLPDYDPASTPEHISAAQALLQQGAEGVCGVVFISFHSIKILSSPSVLLSELNDLLEAAAVARDSTTCKWYCSVSACNVTYIASLDTESLTGPEAVRRCIGDALELYSKKLVQPVSVHFKVSSQGVTVTDNTRRLFFRRHYPVQSVTFAGIDPADRRWDNSCIINEGLTSYVKSARMFAFVARKIGSRTDNACHVFAELEPEQPASAVVNFITKVMMGRK